jgi:hypothetical protein
MGRVDTSNINSNVRVYLFMKGSTPVWVAWYENPKQLILPGDTVPSITIPLVVGKSSVTVESVITQDGGTTSPSPSTSTVTGQNNIAVITLTPTPVYIY